MPVPTPAPTKRPTVLVTGASGTVGSELLRHLSRRECHIRIAERNPDSRMPPHGGGSVIGEGPATGQSIYLDFLDPASYKPALTGVNSLFLLRPPAISDVERYIAPVIRSARESGVRRIVFLSIQGVESKSWVPHHKIERHIVESGIAYTFLRCGFFMQNLATTHRREIFEADEIVVPAGRSLTAFVDTRDIAEIAAAELLEVHPEPGNLKPANHDPDRGPGPAPHPDPSAANRTFTLTGPKAISYFEAASVLSTTLGRTIRYRSPNVISFLFRQRRLGKPWRFAFVMTMLYTITRFGNASEVTTDAATLLGRPLRSFDQFALDYRLSWEREA